MLAAQAIFVLAATLAVYRCLASHLGAWHALPLVFAVGACLVWCMQRHERSRPVALKMGVDGLTAWDRAGRLLVKGQVTGCAQWSDCLLVLALMPEHGRLHTLLVPADTLTHSAFRKLAVLGRRAAGA
ncbi:hypothetical protein AAGS40_10415 [Paraburkholderia sp. PREW-6R]|uniref:hypothetical protein n=1 Tax=Paraburkholderia sp. PREW-6R TaxID=3141544 RepID=UPI0031F5C60C